jgi:hypothetical protein
MPQQQMDSRLISEMQLCAQPSHALAELSLRWLILLLLLLLLFIGLHACRNASASCASQGATTRPKTTSTMHTASSNTFERSAGA